MLYFSLFCLNLVYVNVYVPKLGGGVVPKSDVYKYSDPSDACVVLGLIGHGIRANKHRAGGMELECTPSPTDQGEHSNFIKAKTDPK